MPGGLLRAGVPIKTRYAYTPPRRRQPPRNLCDVPLSGWYHIQDCYTLAQQRHVGNPQSAVEELVIFVTYFFNDSKQTHLLQTGPQNLGTRVVLQPVPRDGTPAHAAWRAWWRVSPAPRPAPPCLRPTWQGAPTWSKETSQQMLRPGNWWVTSPIFTPGKGSCTWRP